MTGKGTADAALLVSAPTALLTLFDHAGWIVCEALLVAGIANVVLFFRTRASR